MTITPTLAELALRSHKADWTRAQWELLPADGNRYEIIDGVLYITTAPSSFHQWIIQQIFLCLHQQLATTGIGFVFVAPVGLFMPGCDPVQPDILVVRQSDLGIIRDRHIYGIPALIVEVLSPFNAEQDPEIKRRAYARAGVPEYWIARPVERDVLLNSRPDPASGQYLQVSQVAPDGELASPTLLFCAAVSQFFAGAPDTTV